MDESNILQVAEEEAMVAPVVDHSSTAFRKLKRMF